MVEFITYQVKTCVFWKDYIKNILFVVVIGEGMNFLPVFLPAYKFPPGIYDFLVCEDNVDILLNKVFLKKV